MGARDKSRFTTAQAGWIALVIFGGWLAFLFLPNGRDASPPDRSPASLDGEEELQAAGLGYNADWIGLPTYFKAWASRVSWEDDKLQFGYWNPGSRAYTYHFEAVRTPQGIRFRRLRNQPGTNELAEDLDANGMLSTHPFEFPVLLVPTEPFARTASEGAVSEPSPERGPLEIPKVKLDLKVDPLVVPKPDLKVTERGEKK